MIRFISDILFVNPKASAACRASIVSAGGISLLQYFPNHRYRSTFSKSSTPRLEYICHVGEDASHMPRSMHEHDHLCEIVFVYQGAGIYMIDGRRYTAQKGDLIFTTAIPSTMNSAVRAAVLAPTVSQSAACALTICLPTICCPLACPQSSPHAVISQRYCIF